MGNKHQKKLDDMSFEKQLEKALKDGKEKTNKLKCKKIGGK